MLTEIHPGIYSCKNYIDQSSLDYYTKILGAFTEEEWYTHANVVDGDIAGHYLDGKLSKDIVQRPLHEKLINDFATKKMWIFCHGNFLRLKAGESSTIPDSCTDVLINYENIIPYKIALYISEFEGGEIVFPEIGLEYKPEIGELLVIKIDKELDHYTKSVISGTRYVYMDYLVRHPGYYMP